MWFIVNVFFYTDVDECVDDMENNCHPNATCMNLIGSFQCNCSEGFTGDGVNCTGKLCFVES